MVYWWWWWWWWELGVHHGDREEVMVRLLMLARLVPNVNDITSIAIRIIIMSIQRIGRENKDPRWLANHPQL